MTLLDRFRRRPRWEHPDPEIRAEAVRELKSEEQGLLEELARHDPDARVRRAAVRRVASAAVLASLGGDGDAGVREEVAEALMALAMGKDAAGAEVALVALSEPRQLVALARSASLAAVRQAALARLADARPLATVARAAEDASIRLEALRRLDEADLLADVASRSEHKDVALAAVERIEDLDTLREIAARGRNKAASRRARARLEEKEPALPEPPPTSAREPIPPAATLVEAPHPVEPEAVETAVVLPPPVADAPAPAVDSPEPPPQPAKEERVSREEARAAHERERKEQLARVEGLCARLEGLVASAALTLRVADARLREARAAQEGAPDLPVKLAQRLKAARASLFGRAQELREADEWSRWGNATAQEELCRRMESLVAREDLEQVAHALHEADVRWAEVRHAPRDEAEALRQRYQAARAQVKARVDAFFAKKAAAEAENLTQKRDLCQRAEALADSTEWLKASEELKSLQARWKQIGPTPRRHSQALWKRFRGACDRFFTRRHEDLGRRKEEWAANFARKDALCTRAESLVESSDWDATAAEMRKLQAEWKGIGPVKKSRSEQVWQRFRNACDAFFERYKRRDELKLGAQREEREALCRELEGLLPQGEERAAAPEGLSATIQALIARARQAPPLPQEIESALSRRFFEARDRVIEAYPASFRGTDLDPEANRVRREKLCAKVEALLSQSDASQASGQTLSGEELVRRLKEALAANTMGSPGDADARRRGEVEEVESAQAAWKRLGPVPGEAGAELEARFRKACTRFFAERPPAARRGRPQAAAR